MESVDIGKEEMERSFSPVEDSPGACGMEMTLLLENAGVFKY